MGAVASRGESIRIDDATSEAGVIKLSLAIILDLGLNAYRPHR